MNDKQVFHHLTLSTWNMRLLGKLERAKKSRVPLREFLGGFMVDEKIAHEDGYSFVNQGSILAHFYIIVVWAHERFEKLLRDVFPDSPLSEAGDSYPDLGMTIRAWEAQSKSPHRKTLRRYVQHLRNSLAHGDVHLDQDGGFRFMSICHGRPHTELVLTFEEAGRLCDALYFELARIIYGGHPNLAQG